MTSAAGGTDPAAGLLDTFLQVTGTSAPSDIALRTLTLHMLQHLAPRRFASRSLHLALTAGLERCADLPFTYDGSGAELEVGVDAFYLRRLAGLPSPAVELERFARALARLQSEGEGLYAWLLGEQVGRFHPEVKLRLGDRPFRTPRLHDGYYLTHLVLLDTDYFARPVSHPDASAWADALLDLGDWLVRRPNADLLGEVVITLKALGRDVRALMQQVHVSEPDDHHSLATLLLAHAAE